MRKCMLVSCAVVLIIASSIFAQDASGAGAPNAASPFPFDRGFAAAVKLYAWHETEIGRLAEQRASSDDVRSFGAMLANQASKLSADLTDIAVSMDLKLQPESTVEHSPTWHELQKLSGSAFDRRFLAEVERDQQDALRIFNAEIQRGQNPQLRQFAINSLSLLEQNLAAVKKMLPANASELRETEPLEPRYPKEGNPREPRPTNPAGGSTTTHWQY